MFLTDLSCIHVWMIKAIPVAGLLVALPFQMELDVEMYFWFRQNIGVENFVEEAFNAAPYNKRLSRLLISRQETRELLRYGLNRPIFSRMSRSRCLRE